MHASGNGLGLLLGFGPDLLLPAIGIVNATDSYIFLTLEALSCAIMKVHRASLAWRISSGLHRA